MAKLSGFIYDTALRRFRPGEVSFGERIEELSFGAASSSLYIIPGLIDSHMHIESSMLTPSSFAEVSARSGTTTILSDCHEITNVEGPEGLVRFMSAPVINHTFYALPSSVPSTPWETSGGRIDEEETHMLAKDRRIIALGEVMNAHDLFSMSDNRTKRIIRAFKEERPECPLEGHCPRFSGKELDRFISSGVDSDHTGQSVDNMLEKLSKGMFIQIQHKSVKKEIIEALTEEHDGHFAFVTDDVLPDVLVSEGHLVRVLRKAIELGMSPERAVYAATWSPAVRLRLFDRGWIAPGKLSDIVVLSDKEKLTVEEVYVSGKLVFRKGQEGEARKVCRSYPPSIHRAPVRVDDFRLRALRSGRQMIVAVGHRCDSTMTERAEAEVDVPESLIIEDSRINILASVERYGHNRPVVPVPLVNGLRKRGAICSSWAHDSHNLLVLSTSADLAARAVNLVIEAQGGIACVDDEGSFLVPLPYAGIVSDCHAEELAEGISRVRRWLREHGYEAEEEIMSFAVLALPVSPELKVSDFGLVDVKAGKLIDWRTV